MKLASISSDGTAHCIFCGWSQRAPSFRLVYGNKKKEALPLENKIKLMETAVLAHLRDAHDRLLLTKDEIKLEDGVRIEYHGRKPDRDNQKMLRIK